MRDFIVNEADFVLEMEDDGPARWLEEGERFPDGRRVGERIDSTSDWQLYYSADGELQILAVRDHVGDRWIREGYLEESDLMPWQSGEQRLWLLFSPCTLALTRMTDLKLTGNTRRAQEFIAAVAHTRSLDPGVNLRDGFFCELFSLVLPTFSLTPAVADRALFENAIREKHEGELLDSPQAMDEPGLNPGVLRRYAGKGGFVPPAPAPWLNAGEVVDDFVRLQRPQALITGAVLIRERYQLYATDAEALILLLDADWALELTARGFLNLIELKTIQIGGRIVRALALSRHQAAEALDDRNFGFDERGLWHLCLSLAESRGKCPQAVLRDGLYLEELGLVLPSAFTGGERAEDAALLRQIFVEGPFALAPFTDAQERAALCLV